MKLKFDRTGRITKLTIAPHVLYVLFGGHEYAVSRQKPPLNHFTNGYGLVETSITDDETVFRGVLTNPRQEEGVCTFENRYKLEKGYIRLKARRKWLDEASVYDDSLFFITRPLNYFSGHCNKCRKPLREGKWWQHRICQTCPYFEPWWRQFKVYSPNGNYFHHYSTKPRLYKIEEDNLFHSDEPIVTDYSRRKNYKEFQVFTEGIAGSYAEIVGSKFGLRLEVLSTNCTQAQLRIVTARHHQYAEMEFQFANHGRRREGMTHTLDCRLRPMRY